MRTLNRKLSKMTLGFVILTFSGCAQFETIDRSVVNKPALSLKNTLTAQAPTGLTNQRAGSKSNVGACTVCAH